MTSVGAKKRRRSAAAAALLCALVASLATAAGAAAAEEGDSAPLRPVSDGGISWPQITSPAGFEKYPIQFELGPELAMRQIDEHEVVVEYPDYGVVAWSVKAPLEHDVVGANVPTTLVLSEGDVVTFIVHHRAGNPAAGGAPFIYPITMGEGWEGGYYSVGYEMNDSPTTPAPTAPAPAAPICTVPSLHGLSLKSAKARLRAAHCSIGQVRLAPDASAGKGEVVKQFRTAGSELAAGTPVAVKLGSPGPR